MTTIDERPQTLAEATDALGVDDECEAGGEHRWEWVPAGIDTGLHFPGVFCAECNTARNNDEDDGPDPDDARDEAWDRANFSEDYDDEF